MTECQLDQCQVERDKLALLEAEHVTKRRAYDQSIIDCRRQRVIVDRVCLDGPIVAMVEVDDVLAVIAELSTWLAEQQALLASLTTPPTTTPV
jgi:hypothetical protein